MKEFAVNLLMIVNFGKRPRNLEDVKFPLSSRKWSWRPTTLIRPREHMCKPAEDIHNFLDYPCKQQKGKSLTLCFSWWKLKKPGMNRDWRLYRSLRQIKTEHEMQWGVWGQTLSSSPYYQMKFFLSHPRKLTFDVG